ncbi:glycosyltransferase family 39 protein [Bryobacter aggregatus]|uniref:glycosyltransferase family 39 protein n=1 Tax=Bryobacter aggregatus TaxID=360054 RepID=UPI00138E1EC9|nr:glycosyltransferase family 39 protein [Bryobacter aggregatus]
MGLCCVWLLGLPGDWLLDDFSLLDATFPALSRPRPLTYLSFWLNLKAFGATPWAFRLTNILLHAVGVQLCYRALRRLIGDQRAFLAAAAFAISPIQADAVLYIFGRPIVLMGVFLWLALERWVDGRHWISFGAFLLALTAKEEAVAFPVFLLALRYCGPKLPGDLRAVSAMLVCGVGTALTTALLAAKLQGSGAGAQSGVNALSYFATQPKVIAIYLQQLLLPSFLGFTWQPSLWPPAGALLWLLPLMGIWMARAKSWILWPIGALLFLLPTSSILPIADVAAFRRMYLPTAFLFAALPVLQHQLVAAWILILTGVTGYRAHTLFAHPEQLWLATFEQQPGDSRALLQACRYLPPDQALLTLEQHREFSSQSDYQTELGRVYLDLKRPVDALRAFGKALGAEPGKASNLYNRGVALLAIGQRDAAKADFERTLQIDPAHRPAREALEQLATRKD